MGLLCDLRETSATPEFQPIASFLPIESKNGNFYPFPHPETVLDNLSG
jgi:hypothetical protein